MCNVMHAQPVAMGWDDSFGGNAHKNMNDTSSPCGDPATHWAQSGLPGGNWIKFYPNAQPYSAGLIAGHKYTASIMIAGTGTDVFLNIWDGNGGAGIGDNGGAHADLSAMPQKFTANFTMGAGIPEFQVRFGGGNVDMTMSNLAIVSADGLPCGAPANLMQAQPVALGWGDSFGDIAKNHMTNSTSPCGDPATHWVEANVPSGGWIKVLPAASPYNATLVAGQKYTATVRITGTASNVFLNIWDGNGGAGIGDNPSTQTDLSATPHIYTVSFTMGTGAPELQVRAGGGGNVDMLIWGLSIVSN
jgi:hypothetical protein